MKDTYNNLLNFWNKSFVLNDEDKKELENINPDDYKSIAPNMKLVDALRLFTGCENVLDYGAGNGWASIIMAKCGAKHIKSVDVAPNFKNVVEVYSKSFNVYDKLDIECVDYNYLNNVNDDTFDGFFVSNVVDVIPYDMAVDIINNAARITKPGSTIIFSMNYYIDTKLLNVPGYVVEGSHIYIDGILRLNSLSDDEWKNIFSKYFKCIKLSYFSWPGEDKEKRRLFIMKK